MKEVVKHEDTPIQMKRDEVPEQKKRYIKPSVKDYGKIGELTRKPLGVMDQGFRFD